MCRSASRESNLITLSFYTNSCHSRSSAPCAFPLSQLGAMRFPPLAARRLALSRLSPPGALRCPPRDAERHVDTEELWEQR
eukprot:6185409-Pleurochrysis_carterae.AAC.1